MSPNVQQINFLSKAFYLQLIWAGQELTTFDCHDHLKAVMEYCLDHNSTTNLPGGKQARLLHVLFYIKVNVAFQAYELWQFMVCVIS